MEFDWPQLTLIAPTDRVFFFSEGALNESPRLGLRTLRSGRSRRAALGRRRAQSRGPQPSHSRSFSEPAQHFLLAILSGRIAACIRRHGTSEGRAPPRSYLDL